MASSSKGKAVEIDFDVAILLDHFDGVVENGERGEAEEIHFEEADTLEGVHVVLRGDFVAVGLVDGNEFGERLRRDDHAGGVRGGVTGKAFEAQSDLHQIFEALVGIDGGFELRRFLEGDFEFDAERGGDELGEAIDFAVRNVHGAADVFDGGFGGHGAEGDDLGDIVAAVFLGDVIDELAAAAHAEIDVDIGHGNALGIEEALEEQIVLERIDVGDAQRVADETAGGGTATGADGNFLGARVLDEIPNDQEVAFIVHLLDHFDFGAEAALVLGKRIAKQILLGETLELRNALGKTFAGDFFEIAAGSVACGNLELREGRWGCDRS